MSHIKGFKICMMCEHEAKMAPSVAREGVVCGAEQQAREPARARDIFQRLQQCSPKALVPAAGTGVSTSV